MEERNQKIKKVVEDFSRALSTNLISTFDEALTVMVEKTEDVQDVWKRFLLQIVRDTYSAIFQEPIAQVINEGINAVGGALGVLPGKTAPNTGGGNTATPQSSLNINIQPGVTEAQVVRAAEFTFAEGIRQYGRRIGLPGTPERTQLRGSLT